MDCAGILLTGGASRRMGRDKAGLRAVPGGPTLAEAAGAVLAGVAAPAIEVGAGISGLPSVSDTPREGPLRAAAAGLAALAALTGSAQAVILLACDLPFIGPGLLRWLVDHPGDRSVVPLQGGRPQPLCARWSRAGQESIARAAGAGERSFAVVLEGADVLLVEPPAALAFGLADVDTPEEWRRLGLPWPR